MGEDQTLGEEQKDFNIREYLLVLVKRRWMILAITLIIVTLAAIYSFLQPPMYWAKSTLLIDRRYYQFVPDVVSTEGGWEPYETFAQTQYKLMKSTTMSSAVAKNLNMTMNNLGQTVTPATDPKELAEQYKDAGRVLANMLSIIPIRDTYLCDLGVAAPDPELAMTIANTWADEYVQFTLATQYEYTQKAESLLVQQVKTLQNEIGQKEKVLQDYSLAKQVVKFGDESPGVSVVAALSGALTLATQDRIAKEIHFNDLKRKGPTSLGDEASDHLVEQIRTDLSEMEHQYQEKLKIYKPDYPEIIRLRSQIEQTKVRLNNERSSVYRQSIATAQASYQEAANKEAALKQQIDTAKRDSVTQNRNELDYDRLKLEIDNKKQLLRDLLTKQSETAVSARVQENKASTIRIVDRAELPTSQSSPQILRDVGIAFMLGLFLSIGLSFGLEFLDNTLKSAEDVERQTNLPFLGVVPRYLGSHSESTGNGQSRAVVKQENTLNSPSEAIDLLTLYNPSSVASEAFKTVRTSLLLAFPEAPPRTILITSSRPGEGKTFVATNLAISLTQLDKKVILIDADMRNPRLHRVWGLKNDTGLSRFLTSDVQTAEVTRPTKVKDLSIITSGPKTPRPAELLSSSRMQKLLEQLQEQYDHIVIDSPPLMPVADAVIMAGKCSSTIMVVKGGATPRDVVRMATFKLSKSDAVIAGVVLNSIDFSDPYYYYRYYSQYGYAYRYPEKQAMSELKPPPSELIQ